MFFFGNKKTQKNTQKKSPKKPRSNTFILEEIISPSAYCPVPIDDSIVNYSIFELFTEEELITAILGTKEPPNITDINTESLVQHYWEEIKKYFQENPTEADSFNLEDLSTWPTLDALINPEAPTVEIPDVGGAVDTLPPPTIVPIDPPRKNPDSGGQEPIIDNSPQPPTLVNAISDLTLTPEISSQTIDISRVFATPNGEQLKYEVISMRLLNVRRRLWIVIKWWMWQRLRVWLKMNSCWRRFVWRWGTMILSLGGYRCWKVVSRSCRMG